MDLFDVIAILLGLVAVFSFINQRYFRFPMVIGLMIISLAMALVFLALEHYGAPAAADWAQRFVGAINFNATVLHGLLSFILFAGALHVDLNRLREQRRMIALFALGGVVVSTFLVGTLMWVALGLLGVRFPYIYSLLFGALISPTDPIAVLAILRKVGMPSRLEIKIVGESLFNDGIAVVLFIVILQIAEGGTPGPGYVVQIFAREAAGGVGLGLLGGGMAYWMLRRVDNYQVEVMITLGLVTGIYDLADTLAMSGPLAVVVAGLIVGNHGRSLAMSAKTRRHLDSFWELIDEVVNAILFILIGLQVLVLPYILTYFVGGVVAIPTVLLSRWITVGVPVTLLRPLREFVPHAIKIMTWGGLRGGISVAMALSVPRGPEHDIIVTMTYMVVIFSILVQGLTIGRLVAIR